LAYGAVGFTALLPMGGNIFYMSILASASQHSFTLA